MKKITLIILTIIMFTGCSNFMYVARNVTGHELYIIPDFEFFDSYHNIAGFIRSNVQYQSESGDYWKNPEETWNEHCGDCEDFAILFMNIVYISTGEKLDLVLVNIDDIKEVNSIDDIPDAPQKINGVLNHAMCAKGKLLIDPYTGKYFSGATHKRYSFDYIFGM